MAIVVKAKKVGSVVPDGVYQARLSGVKTFSNSFGDRVGFEFEILEGQYKGSILMRSTSPVMASRKGKLYDMLAGLLGREMTQGEMEGGLDVEGLIGAKCAILVTKSSNKQGQVFSNIDKVMQISANMVLC